MTDSTNAFRNALTQLSRATAVRPFSKKLLTLLSAPEREIKVSIPVTMDDGSLQVFEGYRVQYSSIRGPYKGGIRYHAQTDVDEVRALAFWMTIKTAVANIPMGGGKGGITLDPKKLSKGELERLSRGWVKALYLILGPHTDIPAPDVNTTPEIIGWMADEYAKLTGDKTGAAFTGKPIERGGSEGRTVATGLGGYYTFEAIQDHMQLPNPVRVIIQGMGNVGGHAAQLFHEHGAVIVGMSDSKGGILSDKGLNPTEVEHYKQTRGSLTGFPGTRQVTNAELLTAAADVLVPAALENQITVHNANDIQAMLVLELANGPTTPEADDILLMRNIRVIPDILANAGGVIVSTFEWKQNLCDEHWDEIRVHEQLRHIMREETRNLWKRAEELKTDLRRAAFIVALERLESALLS